MHVLSILFIWGGGLAILLTKHKGGRPTKHKGGWLWAQRGQYMGCNVTILQPNRLGSWRRPYGFAHHY